MTAHAPRKVIFAPFMTGFGGVERLVLGLSRFLDEQLEPHCVLTFSNSIDLQSYSDSPVDVVVLASPRNPILEALALRRWTSAEAAATGSTDPVLVFDLRGAFYASLLSVPFAVHVTDPPSLLSADVSKHAPSRTKLWGNALLQPGKALRAETTNYLNKRGLARATTLIAMTERISREIRELYDRDAVVIRPGVMPPAQRSPRPVHAGVRFLSISRLVSSKRIDWVLDATAEAKETFEREGIEWSLQIVGSGPELDRLAAQSRRLGLDRNVVFSGGVDQAGLEEAYDAASVFLMPAAQGWGLPALEALSRGVPVVVHEDSGVTEILTDSPWVERISDPDGRDLAGAMVRIANRVNGRELENISPPAIPLEREWAEKICVACSWLPNEVGR
ncbi:MAG TPA: glycosyltransferase family 4 protein [Gemmatimonadaceae bacterium]|nr:glycosyltransferase family 4 protein [Gemmatimonadaceae bacterium]